MKVFPRHDVCTHALIIDARSILSGENVRARVGLYECGRNHEKIWPAHVSI
jgi:hypothetical protein